MTQDKIIERLINRLYQFNEAARIPVLARGREERLQQEIQATDELLNDLNSQTINARYEAVLEEDDATDHETRYSKRLSRLVGERAPEDDKH